MKIRDAVLGDVQGLVWLGQLLQKESQYAQYNYNKEKSIAILEWLIKTPDGIVFIAEKEGELMGGFVGCVVSHWFSDCTVSFDYALFVKPEKRGTMLGARLIKRYIEKAKKLGVDEVLIGYLTAIRPDNIQMLERLYEKLGFERQGGKYRYPG